MLVEITLKKETQITLNLTQPKETTFLGAIINQKRGTEPIDLTLNPNDLPFSSVVRFAIFPSLKVMDAGTVNKAYVVDETALNTNSYSFFNSETFAYVNPFAVKTYTTNKLYVYFDYASSLVEYINEQVMYYVDEAQHATDGEYDTILLGQTNLTFLPDFSFEIKEGGN